MTVVTIIEKNKDSSIASFTNNIQKIGEQLQESNKIKQEANDFNNRGFFGRLSGSITSRNDTDLATMIAKLGGSLNITQEVIQCLLQIQSEKNVVLKEFHLALMNTIRDLKYNDTILDLSSRENTQVILEHLKSQVEDKLEQAQRVEEHEEAINRLQSLSWQQEEMLQRLQASQDEHATQVVPKLERQQQEQWQQSGKLALALEEQADQYQQQLALLMDKLALQENVATGMAARISELEKTSRLKRAGLRDYLLFATSALAAGLVVIEVMRFNGVI
ncbi:TPA: hypothetical protein RFT21_004734 [Klebsiella pneumoniae subsp. pneumoniae]|uniref:hypothetical protein n=1 Tax=Klebsiella pneumoniae complex TaxID=3390273 RepID=UPI000DE77387|nr:MULTISPECIES: hypothetical protein [Klebsiella]HBR2048950.1 hypothetical protein [Klebsiella quasipneumoniae subsp. similipneumoniae]HDU4452017.1 hypothetical protein [Klebsiella pneumoniae subsp. pneumoniae]ELA2965803.1 hypothetical protein [Klebsiella variicola]MBS3687493.1 hypothetical protein [Klebsiella quasipneumoniae]MCI8264672.1 hypothetical protein [Klebsiella pneumoniae]